MHTKKRSCACHAFFTEIKLEKPKMSIEKGKAMIKPTYLTNFEGVLVTSFLIQNMTHCTKCSTQSSVSRKSISCQTNK